MRKSGIELPADRNETLVVGYSGCWQVIDRRRPFPGETVLAYSPIPGDGRLLVGKYDGRSITDGSATWTTAIIRGVVICTIPIAGNGDAETQSSAVA